MKKEYKYHYVYRITNKVTGYHYYGSKSCNETPRENIGKKYFLTSLNQYFIEDQKNNPQDYKYKVIKVFETKRDDAILLESKLHFLFDVRNHPKFINRSNQTPNGFDMTGKTVVKDKITKANKVISLSEYDSEIYESVHKGKITVFDEKDDMYKFVTVDEYKDDDGLKSLHNGKVAVIDDRTGERCYVTTEDYYKFDYYKSHNIGQVTVYDIINKVTKNVTKDEYDSCSNFVFIDSKVFKIFDSNGTHLGTAYGNFKDYCKKQGYPFSALSTSARENGKPIYQSLKNNNSKKMKFKNWYAISDKITNI